jgi:hypothetical protein
MVERPAVPDRGNHHRCVARRLSERSGDSRPDRPRAQGCPACPSSLPTPSPYGNIGSGPPDTSDTGRQEGPGVRIRLPPTESRTNLRIRPHRTSIYVRSEKDKEGPQYMTANATTAEAPKGVQQRRPETRRPDEVSPVMAFHAGGIRCHSPSR